MDQYFRECVSEIITVPDQRITIHSQYLPFSIEHFLTQCILSTEILASIILPQFLILIRMNLLFQCTFKSAQCFQIVLTISDCNID